MGPSTLPLLVLRQALASEGLTQRDLSGEEQQMLQWAFGHNCCVRGMEVEDGADRAVVVLVERRRRLAGEP